MRLQFRPGLSTDSPPIAPADDLRWLRSNNWRWRRLDSTGEIVLETVGLCVAVTAAVPDGEFSYADEFSPDFDIRDFPLNQVDLGFAPWTLQPYSAPDGSNGILAAGLNRIVPVLASPGAPATAPTFAAASAVLNLSPGLSLDVSTGPLDVPVHPFWTFLEEDDLMIGLRTGAAESPWSWTKNPAQSFAPLANAPRFAVGGAILDRILVLLGAESLTHPDPGPSLTVRWSDRFDFTDWTPSDTNLSGELRLEGGSRIVGGGATRFGLAAWTDANMALLSETGDNLVLARRYVDGAVGLLSSRAWCEADGRVWWLSPQRDLWVYDGGAARRVPCPLDSVTLRARMSAEEAPWFQITPVPHYDELWISYRVGCQGANRVLIYNYALDLWYPATFFLRPDRPDAEWFAAFAPARAAVPVVSAHRAPNGRHHLSFHDTPDDVGPAYEVFDGDAAGVVAALRRPHRFLLESAPFVLSDETQSETSRTTSLYLDARVDRLPGEIPDVFSCDPCASPPKPQMLVTMRGVRRGEDTGSVSVEQAEKWTERLPDLHYRVAGRQLQLRIEHPRADAEIPALTGRIRLGGVWINGFKDGQR